ncbi:MAG: hypothetical protein DMD81_22780, partial [Candidatus Rokuibacteriota bacterium]
ALEVRPTVQLVAGRMFRPGLAELVVGKNVPTAFSGFDLGSTVRFGGSAWTIVGVVDAGGTAFDSEVWADATVLKQVFQRPPSLFQSVTVRLTSAEAFDAFKDALTSDPRVTVQIDREVDYYAKQSRQLTTLITVLGSMVAAVMGIGAVFGALNTMYSAVTERAREIATMRALGFAAGSVVVSFVIESLCLALVGGLLGCAVVLPLNGLTTGTMNWQTSRCRLRAHDGPGRRRAAGDPGGACARRGGAARALSRPRTRSKPSRRGWNVFLHLADAPLIDGGVERERSPSTGAHHSRRRCSIRRERREVGKHDWTASVVSAVRGLGVGHLPPRGGVRGGGSGPDKDPANRLPRRRLAGGAGLPRRGLPSGAQRAR